MKLTPNKQYTVTKKIKIHTKPLVECVVLMTGVFVKETDKYLIFCGFKVKKSVIQNIEKV